MMFFLSLFLVGSLMGLGVTIASIDWNSDVSSELITGKVIWGIIGGWFIIGALLYKIYLLVQEIREEAKNDNEYFDT